MTQAFLLTPKLLQNEKHQAAHHIFYFAFAGDCKVYTCAIIYHVLCSYLMKLELFYELL